MALPTATPAPLPSPQVVGKAFVSQYYHILHQSPELVHRFYHDSSILSRPDSDGVMTSVTTLQGINDKILSFNISSYIEIETADSQASYKEGVIIVVTGCLTGSDNVRRKFTQSFFLARQDNKGFFVLNDIFRFVDLSHPKESNEILENGVSEILENGVKDSSPKRSITPEPDPSLVQESHVEDSAIPPSDGDHDNGHGQGVHNSSENVVSVVEDGVAVNPAIHSNHPDEPPVPEGANSVAQDDGQKKSYASIVKVKKASTSPKQIYAPATRTKVATPTTEKPKKASETPASKSEAPVAIKNYILDNKSSQAEGYSIHVKNLPENVTAEQVKEEFKKFGPVKPNGVQVRNSTSDNYCYGFVEFESLESMQTAIKASPIFMEGQKVQIEPKRTSTRVVNGIVMNSNNGRGRLPALRNVPRNDNFRGRGGYMANNQGYVRTDFRSRGEFSGRGWGRGPVGEGYQHRAFQNGNGRVGRPSGLNQTVSA